MQVKPFAGLMEESGDIGFVRHWDRYCFFSLVDALGHGCRANGVAMRALAGLEQHFSQPLDVLLHRLHHTLEGTQGAVASVCRLDLQTGVLEYAGVGNVCLKLFGSSRKRLMLNEGVLGYMMATPKVGQVQMRTGDLLLMSTDGLREHFDTLDFPELESGRAEQIVRRCMEALCKGNDDASCIALRFGIL
ncbi:SpoIIE family protein phosphatase [Oleidesulfovibrio sp.]|uniref:SpoIIE family protein phosphatase n=1 Tax=Oleidesulfovibrio sp. TaxID=2909707 RepID=UPI003A88F6F1